MSMMRNDHITFIYVPCGTEGEAATIAARLVSEGLIACGNIHASRSIYMWQGKPVDETEYVLLAKTTKSLSSAAEKRIQEMHSYEIPCVIAFSPDSVNRAYEVWLNGEVQLGRRDPDPRGEGS
jgi:periplasmic divalent cation tolerance protein